MPLNEPARLARQRSEDNRQEFRRAETTRLLINRYWPVSSAALHGSRSASRRTTSYDGCKDLGGTLMNESISKAAGTQHGQELPPEAMECLIRRRGAETIGERLGLGSSASGGPGSGDGCSVLHDRLTTYVEGSPAGSERMLAERCAFEHQVRHYIGRANERGFSPSMMFPGFASIWVDFVDQNKMLEQTIQRIDRHRAYDEGRNDQAQITSAPTVWPLPSSIETSPASQVAAVDPLQLIRSLVAES